MRTYCFPLLLLCACSEAESSPSDSGESSRQGDASPDAGEPLWTASHYCTIGDARIPVGMRFANGCNDCWCNLTEACGGSECPAVCTAVACADAGPTECSAAAGCGVGHCNFVPGCVSASGYCSYVQSTCHPTTPQPWDPDAGLPPMLFCGCDGVTYASDCPGVPYAHAGPCP